MPGSLEGIRVVDLTSVLLGPYCTRILADLGADVIKVESPGGDVFRQVGRAPVTRGVMGPIHMAMNSGKRSIVLDLKTASAIEDMKRLLETADVFIHNVRQSAIARLGLDYESVRKLRPDIVYVHCVGYGSDGPYAEKPAYDDVIQAASGLADLLTRMDGDPTPRYLPTAVGDKVSGLHAAYATLAALLHRIRHGEGQFVEVPMFESVTSFVLAEHLYGMTFVPPTGDVGYDRVLDPDRRPFPTADGFLSIVPYSDEHWRAFLGIAGRLDVLEDERFSTYRARTRNIGQLYKIVAEITPSRTSAAWEQLLADADIPVMRLNRLDELTSDPHLSAVEFFVEREHPTEGKFLEVRQPVRFSAGGGDQRRVAPQLGEHTSEILAELRGGR